MKKIKTQIVLAALGLFIVIVALVGLYVYQNNRVDMSTIEYIQSMQKGPSDFLDLANDINVSSADDVGFIVNSEYNINIHYGSQILEMNRKCFMSEQYRKGLEKIGILVYTHVNEDGSILYKVTYWGEEVDQYSKVD